MDKQKKKMSIAESQGQKTVIRMILEKQVSWQGSSWLSGEKGEESRESSENQ